MLRTFYLGIFAHLFRTFLFHRYFGANDLQTRQGSMENFRSGPSPARIIQRHEIFWEGSKESLSEQIFRFKTHDPGSQYANSTTQGDPSMAVRFQYLKKVPLFPGG